MSQRINKVIGRQKEKRNQRNCYCNKQRKCR